MNISVVFSGGLSYLLNYSFSTFTTYTQHIESPVCFTFSSQRDLTVTIPRNSQTLRLPHNPASLSVVSHRTLLLSLSLSLQVPHLASQSLPTSHSLCLLQEFEAIGPASFLVSGVVMTLLSFVVYLLLYLVAQTITRQSCKCTVHAGGPDHNPPVL